MKKIGITTAFVPALLFSLVSLISPSAFAHTEPTCRIGMEQLHAGKGMEAIASLHTCLNNQQMAVPEIVALHQNIAAAYLMLNRSDMATAHSQIAASYGTVDVKGSMDAARRTAQAQFRSGVIQYGLTVSGDDVAGQSNFGF